MLIIIMPLGTIVQAKAFNISPAFVLLKSISQIGTPMLENIGTKIIVAHKVKTNDDVICLFS